MTSVPEMVKGWWTERASGEKWLLVFAVLVLGAPNLATLGALAVLVFYLAFVIVPFVREKT